MSKLDDLIKEYCPNGVEYKPLGDICTIKTGKTQNAGDGSPDGEYMYFTCQKNPIHIDRWDYDLDALLIAGNCEVGRVHSYKGKFCAYQRVYILSDFDNGINKKFLKYYIQNSLKPYLHKQPQNGMYRYIVINVLKEFEIPLPPLEVQEYIVSILEPMEGYIAELTAELTARKTQYEGILSKVMFEIPLPPLEVQEYIVSILEPMEGYIAELTAELTARKTQYEGILSKVMSPLPPLEVQEYIVSILEPMEGYIAELTAELTARKTQYEGILSKVMSKAPETKKMSEIITSHSKGTGITKN